MIAAVCYVIMCREMHVKTEVEKRFLLSNLHLIYLWTVCKENFELF